jgi:hypothetical protein
MKVCLLLTVWVEAAEFDIKMVEPRKGVCSYVDAETNDLTFSLLRIGVLNCVEGLLCFTITLL